MTQSSAPIPRRWKEQRWAIDSLIAANGVDWDQPRSIYWNAPCGFAASPDFAAVRQNVKKLGDISIEFEAHAERREAIARQALSDGRNVEARENFFIASIHWGAAQWPIFEASDDNLRYNARKRDCFTNYAALAAHVVENVSIPLDGKWLRAWLHFPPNRDTERCPVVVSFPGMDSFKEASVAMYGDTFLTRGIAVLSVDGPGEYEAPLDGVFLTVDSWVQAGKSCVDYLVSRSDIDHTRIGLTGRSFGSFGATMAASEEPRFRGIAVTATCFEPQFESLCESACPTFKARLMFMAGLTDENEFDQFRRELTWKGKVEAISAPFLVVGGQLDELSPYKYAVDLVETLNCDSRLVIYEESRHSVGFGVPSSVNGPNVNKLTADWIVDAFAGERQLSETWFVNSRGEIDKQPITRPGSIAKAKRERGS